MNIPTWAQSSTNPEEISLTITSVGKAGAGIIMFLGVVGILDPTLTAAASPAWAGLVASVVTAVPAGFAVWHSGQAVWGVIRKIAVRISTLFSKTPVTAQQ